MLMCWPLLVTLVTLKDLSYENPNTQCHQFKGVTNDRRTERERYGPLFVQLLPQRKDGTECVIKLDVDLGPWAYFLLAAKSWLPFPYKRLVTITIPWRKEIGLKEKRGEKE